MSKQIYASSAATRFSCVLKKKSSTCVKLTAVMLGYLLVFATVFWLVVYWPSPSLYYNLVPRYSLCPTFKSTGFFSSLNRPPGKISFVHISYIKHEQQLYQTQLYHLLMCTCVTYLYLILKDALNEFSHDSLWTAENLPNLFINPLTQNCNVFKYISPHVRSLQTPKDTGSITVQTLGLR